MNIRSLVLCLALAPLAAAAHASPDRVRFLEGAKAAAQLSEAELAEDVQGYLAPNAVDAGAILPGPPAAGAKEDTADADLARATSANAGETRWKNALADDASLYDRFEEALGRAPNRKTLPRLVRLLNRVSADVLAATAAAKDRFPRPRPYQRFALKRVCGFATPPKPEAAPTKGTSYPSGHAALGWGTALTMMEAAPTRAAALVARGAGYGDSRVVCGLHFPSDVEAGRLLAGAVVDKLLALPEFRRDLVCAKAELEAVAAGQRSEDLPACQ
jgi:acid phosphatase (class A)